MQHCKTGCISFVIQIALILYTFSYTSAVAQDSLCNGLPITVDLNLGQLTTAGDDVVLGTPGDDEIRGKAGNDTICGMGGNDFIHGNSGDDWIDGGEGVDNIRGGQGNDTIYTGSGSTVGISSRVFGGNEDDTIYGGPDADDLRGGRGNDLLYGGAGDDEITGNEDDDIIYGEQGDDLLKGGNGDNDHLVGGDNVDILNGGSGSNDRCNGGNDTGDFEENCEYIALTELAISGTAKRLNPVFDDDVTRYSLVAESSPNDLFLTASASDFAVISVNGSMITDGVPFELIGVLAGDTINITLTGNSGQERNYELLYLPFDFPDLMVTTLTDDVSDGEIFLTLKRQRTPGQQGNQGPNSVYATILDENAVPIFYEEIGSGNNFRKHVNGEFSYSVRVAGEQSTLGRSPYEHVVLDSNFNEIRRVRAVGLQNTDFHEFILKEDDNAVFLSYEPAVRDLSPFGGSVNGDVEDSVLQEVQAGSNNVLTEWNSWDKILYADRLRDAPYDYAHINAFEFTANGDFLVTARGTSQLSMIDGSTGNIVWTLGGISNQFTYVNDPFANICGPHMGRMVSDNRLLLFDNGQFCWPENPARGELTRIVEYQLDFVSMEAELVWSYSQAGNYTTSGGSAQRFENGNTLIGWSRGSNVLVTEVDSNGNKVYELEATYDDGTPATSYRAYRF